MAVLAAWLALAGQNVVAQENKPKQKIEESAGEDGSQERVGFSSKTDFFSKYVFRGFTYSDKPVIQQSVTASYKDLNITGWFNFDTEMEDLNEEDLMIDFAKSLGEVTLLAGYELFTFPNTDIPKTQEVYIGVSLDKVLLNPTLLVFYDFEDGDGTYGEFSLNEGVKFGDVEVLANAKLGYNDHYFRENSGLSHVEIGVAIPINLTDNLAITPNVNYSKSLDDRDFEDELYGGISLELRF